MKDFNIAILGCGTVGGGVAKILLEMKETLPINHKIRLIKIVDLFPKQASKRFDIPIELFCGDGNNLTKEHSVKYINEIITDTHIDLVVETIGGTSQFLLDVVKRIITSKKHLVSANKALLAENIDEIFALATKNNVKLGFEAAVCGAIPIIKTIKESFTGDKILSISGIFNGTSNYILSNMTQDNLSFDKALKLAQEKGYAEQDPSLDINGGDAGHKLAILIKLAFGPSVDFNKLSIKGIENITKSEIDAAKELDCSLKLICYTEQRDNVIYAGVQPMMVKNNNFLSKINGATNAVKLLNKYSKEHVLIGEGAGSLETASSIVADIVFISKCTNTPDYQTNHEDYKIVSLAEKILPYIIIFETEDVPGITGAITTAIGNQGINIDTVGHNRHSTQNKAIFSIATMPCTQSQIKSGIDEVRTKRPDILFNEPLIMPILY